MLLDIACDYSLNRLIIDCNSVTNTVHLTVDIRTRLSIINAVAIADIQAAPGAVPPDRVLDEPREDLWEGGVELPGTNVFGDGLNNVGTAARPIATYAVGVIDIEPAQNAGANQKVVN